MIFTWALTPESFDEIWKQSNLLNLRNEFEMRNRPLSRSLLIWEKIGVTGWLLADFENRNIYHINAKENNPEMEVSESVWDPETLLNRFDDQVYGTREGFVDWLKLLSPRESDLEKLKRPDLSEQKLDFEIVHDDLLVVYEMLREILMSPREWLIDLSSNNIQQIRTYLGQLHKTINRIWGIGLSSDRGTYVEVVQQTFQFCDEVKQQLGQVVTHLKAKSAEQLETTVNTTVAETVEELKAEKDLLQKQREEAEQNESDREKEFAELKNKLADESAKKLTSEQQVTFAEQAERHQDAAWAWLGVASSLVIGLVVWIIFWGLLDILKLEGSEWTVVLQNIFKKGSVLTLFYIALNRSIKNYTAQKHLEVVNRHRQKALDTFPKLVDSLGNNPETRHAVLSAATNAIFDANQTGYLSTKTKGTESVNPIQQVFGAMRSSSTGSGD